MFDTQYFKGKKITVMGLGLLGRGVGDVEFLAEVGADVIVTDLKSAAELSNSVSQLKKYKNIQFVLGEHRQQDFKDRDFILVAAGVPLQSPYLATARAEGVLLKQSAAWFAELSDVPIIGVTGTRGKSTVTHMIHHVLTEITGENILLGGNVRGVSNLQLLNKVQEDSLCVMELDSWQLQGWGWSEISPQIAIFTNLMEDHLNYYQAEGKDKDEAMHLYFTDKSNIFRSQEESGVFVTTAGVFEMAKQLTGVSLGQEVILVDGSDLPEDTLLAMPGEHNRLNAALAVKALEAVSLETEEIFAGLATFKGVSGRLEYLGESNGVKIYNDNNSTTPQATIAGLEALAQEGVKNIILIAGGSDKNINPDSLLKKIAQSCKQVVLLPGTGTDLIKESLEAVMVEDIKEAVEAGLSVGEKGDVLLFSPGFASFGLFKNEYERNDVFVSCVQEIIA